MLRNYFTFCSTCRQIRSIRKFSIDSRAAIAANGQILSDLLGICNKEAIFYIDKHKLKDKDGEVLAENVKLCQSYGYEKKDILANPTLLKVHPIELEQHYKALQEGGFVDILPHTLAKARTYMKRIVIYLKSLNLIPQSTNVPESIISFIKDKEIAKRIRKRYDERNAWNDIHLEILTDFLRLKLNGTEDEINNLIHIHAMVRNKSFRIIQKNIELAEQLGFEPKQIIKYGYILANYPQYTEITLRDLGNLAGIDMKKAMRHYPKLMMTPPRNIIKIYGILKEFDIPDETIKNQPNVFHLSPNTVKVRLQEIERSPDLNVLLKHPRLLSLVVHFNRAKQRLTFLQQSQLECASLTILGTNFNSRYEEHLKEGKDINNSLDLTRYLQNLFSLSQKDVKKKISQHPFYLRVPIKEMQKTYDYLILNKFSKSSIFQVMYILLYPRAKVQNVYYQIQYNKKFNYKSLSQTNKLNLILYLIEKDYHFTGNGIWKNYKLPENVEKPV